MKEVSDTIKTQFQNAMNELSKSNEKATLLAVGVYNFMAYLRVMRNAYDTRDNKEYESASNAVLDCYKELLAVVTVMAEIDSAEVIKQYEQVDALVNSFVPDLMVDSGMGGEDMKKQVADVIAVMKGE